VRGYTLCPNPKSCFFAGPWVQQRGKATGGKRKPVSQRKAKTKSVKKVRAKGKRNKGEVRTRGQRDKE
jgi:hypothetical protein